MNSSQRGSQQLVIIKEAMLSLRLNCRRLVTAFAEAIAPDVGSFLQMDDKHLLLGKLNAPRPPLLQGRVGRRGKGGVVPADPLK